MEETLTAVGFSSYARAQLQEVVQNADARTRGDTRFSWATPVNHIDRYSSRSLIRFLTGITANALRRRHSNDAC